MNSGLKTFLITLLCLLVVAGGCGTYYFYNLSKNLKSDKTKLENQIGDLNKELAAKSAASQVATTKKGTSCVAFSADEKTQMADWKTYTSKTYKYSFQYPASWTLTETSADSVSVKGTDSGGKITFTADVGKAIETTFSGYKLVGTKKVKVNCEDADENHYNGSSNAVLITQNFTKDSNPYLLKFTYTNLGVSYSSGIEQIDSLILKTFAF